jgi:hypothetical protein
MRSRLLPLEQHTTNPGTMSCPPLGGMEQRLTRWRSAGRRELWSPAMNLIVGVLVGILLTIGTAFVADAFVSSDVTSEDCSKQIVNWSIAKDRLHETTASIQTGWDRLKSGLDNL